MKEFKGMIEVSRDDFFEIIYERSLDVTPKSEGKYPYETKWRFRGGNIFGYEDNNGNYFITKDFLNGK